MDGFNFWKVGWGWAAVLALMLIVVAMCAQGERTSDSAAGDLHPPSPTAATTIKTAGAAANPADGQAWPGVVHAQAVVDVAPQMAAMLLAMHVNVGDRVNRDDVIARLRDKAVLANKQKTAVAQAFATIQASHAALEARRKSGRSDQGAGAAGEADAARADAAAAQAAAERAMSDADDARKAPDEITLRAPSSGVIVATLKALGDTVSPSEPVVTMRTGDMRLEVRVPDRCVTNLTVGMPVKVRMDPGSEVVSGRIDEIVSQGNAGNDDRLMKISLPESASWKEGGFGWLYLACLLH